MRVEGRLMQAQLIEIHQVFAKKNVGYISNRVVLLIYLLNDTPALKGLGCSLKRVYFSN